MSARRSVTFTTPCGCEWQHDNIDSDSDGEAIEYAKESFANQVTDENVTVMVRPVSS